MGAELIQLRYDGTCSVCASPMTAEMNGWLDAAARRITCIACQPPPDSVDTERLGCTLDREIGTHSVVLHDLRVPGTKATIDHIVVASSGLWIIDARYDDVAVDVADVGSTGRPDLRLHINGRSRSDILTTMSWQLETVAKHFERMGFDHLPTRRALCFVNATWPDDRAPTRIDRVWTLWPDALVDKLGERGSVHADVMRAVASELRTRHPANA